MRLSHRAEEIYKNVVNAMQDAEEIDGVTEDEYLNLMEAIRQEAVNRFDTYLDLLRDSQDDKRFDNADGVIYE